LSGASIPSITAIAWPRCAPESRAKARPLGCFSASARPRHHVARRAVGDHRLAALRVVERAHQSEGRVGLLRQQPHAAMRAAAHLRRVGTPEGGGGAGPALGGESEAQRKMMAFEAESPGETPRIAEQRQGVVVGIAEGALALAAQHGLQHAHAFDPGVAFFAQHRAQQAGGGRALLGSHVAEGQARARARDVVPVRARLGVEGVQRAGTLGGVEGGGEASRLRGEIGDEFLRPRRSRHQREGGSRRAREHAPARDQAAVPMIVVVPILVVVPRSIRVKVNRHRALLSRFADDRAARRFAPITIR
jgi:hypothetical protein